MSLICLFFSGETRAETLHVWHAYREGGLEQRALAETLRRFESAHPGVVVETLAVPFESYAAKLGAAIPEGNGPDVFVDAHERAGEFRTRALVAPVGDALSADDEKEYAPTALASVRIDGAIYGVPLSRKCLALYLNDALVPADPPDFETLVGLQASLPKGTFAVAHAARHDRRCGSGFVVRCRRTRISCSRSSPCSCSWWRRSRWVR